MAYRAAFLLIPITNCTKVNSLGDIRPLIADALGDGLFHFHLGGFALDHRHGDTVDKQDNIRPRCLVAAAALHAEFGRHMKDIPFPVLPVDIVQVEALGIALDGLLQGRAQGRSGHRSPRWSFAARRI